ncbi:MAG: DNA-directed RNA polymerase subunit beta [Anaeroplasmataceae bacterium]
MNYKVVNYGKKSKRRSYSRVRTEVELPNLIEIQTNSFEKFMSEGLSELFKSMSPICSHTGDLEISFGNHRFEEPKYSILDSKLRDVNYAKALKVMVSLHNKVSGAIIENEIFMGEIPYMTPVGTFIINGAERVVISQIVRSSGVYFSKEVDKKSGSIRYSGEVLPSRGDVLFYELQSKNLWYAKLGHRAKKVPATTIIKALGFQSNEQILDFFGKSNLIDTTFAKDNVKSSEEAIVELYFKLRDEKTSVDNAREYIAGKLFDPNKYDLQTVGRFKFNTKLNVLSRAKGFKLANDIIVKEDIFDDATGELLHTKGEVIAKAGEKIVGDTYNRLDKARAAFREEVKLNNFLSSKEPLCEVLNVLDVNDKAIKIVGNDSREESLCVQMSDILASLSYYCNLYDGVGKVDDIDHLGNRRLKLIGELLRKQFRDGINAIAKNAKEKMTTVELDDVTPQKLINVKKLSSVLKEFFGSSQLSQFMDQINPLAEITQKRRVSALGAGGLSRDRAGAAVRDVHDSHYGRMCPIETPEGQSIGLITSLATYAQVDKYGFIQTPYLKLETDANGVKYVTNNQVFLSADDEEGVSIASASTKLDDNGYMLEEKIIGRRNGETSILTPQEVEFIDVSPKQVVSVAASCIPFLEHDDATRALMGANMQRQAVPIIAPESPIVGTGMEHNAAKDSGSALVSSVDGIVQYVDAKEIKIKQTNGEIKVYELIQFLRSNSSTTVWQRPIVKVGEEVSKGDILADGQSMQNGELALGRNVRVGFMTWDGYNFEDAVIMSESLVKNDVYTSVHIEEVELQCRDTKLGKEEFTRDIPNVGNEALRYLDEMGVIIPGTEVKEGDILVGKVTPKGQSDPTAEEKLLLAIFGEKSRDVRDTSLRVEHGGGGVVQSVQHFKKENGDELPPGVKEGVRVYIVHKRKISEGDKMAGRHGNKGVISKILPQEDMPFTADGQPLDIMLNPQGVPSRMNIGQVLEVHLGIAAQKLGLKIATPVFDGVTKEDLEEIMIEAGLQIDGKVQLYDGRSGEPFDNKITVGIMYMIKLSHMVDDKLHARNIGPYTLVTQQPMGGKAQNGGQRFGEMEVWALEAYGAAHTLQEMMTVKSDDMVGRNKVHKAIVDGQTVPGSNVPESFRVLTREFQALGLHVELINQDGENEVNKSLVDLNDDEHFNKYNG